jgi:hypothetical protein
MPVAKWGRSGTQYSFGCDFYSMTVTRAKVGGFCYSSNTNKHLLHEVFQLCFSVHKKGLHRVMGEGFADVLNKLNC